MPEADRNPRTLFTGSFLSVVARGRWEFATRTTNQPAVAIVAITDDNCIVLVEQQRIPVDARTLELPAGLSGDSAATEGEPLVEAARRELLEETGYAAARWTQMVYGYSSPGLTDEAIVIYLAEGLEKVSPGGGDDQEDITVHEIPLAGAIDWLQTQPQRVDFKVLAGIALAQHYRQA